MRKYILLFVISILLIILGGCNELVTTDDLIGGKWAPKSGYKDGDRNFKYSLTEASYGMDINFFNPNGELDIFEIIIENEDDLALIGFGDSKRFNCYFEREK